MRSWIRPVVVAALLCGPWGAAGRLAAQIPVEQLVQEAAQQMAAGKFAEAAEVYGMIVAQAPAPAVLEAAQYNQALANFRAGDHARAAEAYRAFLEKHPTSSSAPAARMSLGLALALQEKYAEAIPVFKEVEGVPSLRIDALQYRAEAAVRAGRPEEAIEAFEAVLGTANITPDNASDAVFGLLRLYLDAGELDRADRALEYLRARPALVDSAVRFNSYSIEVADRFQEGARYDRALAILQTVRPKAEVVAAQRRITLAQGQRLQTLQGSGSGAAQVVDAVARLQGKIEEGARLLAELEALPHYDAEIYYRMARAWFELDRPWEAILVFGRIVEEHAGAPNRDLALYGLARAWFAVGRASAARDACDRFRREYPASPLLPQVAFVAGQLAFEAMDFATAEAVFAEALAANPDPALREDILVLLGNARFLNGRLEEAKTDYRGYLRDYPEGRHVEDVQYRLGMASFFAGDYAGAVEGLREYLARYPGEEGRHGADVAYRLAVCSFSARDYAATVDAALDWLRAHPDHILRGEVYALLGDTHNALGDTDRALMAYRDAMAHAGTDEVVGYALGEITRIFQARGDYAAIAALHEEFVRSHPDHVLVPESTYWIGRARTREGKVDEAKAFLGATIVTYMGDPAREGVEKLITQLARLVSLRPRAQPGAPRPPPKTLTELSTELEALLAGAADVNTNTAKARLLYARAELARLNRLETEQGEILDSMAAVFRPEELSAGLLGVIGDRLLARGDAEGAERFFARQVALYPRSEFADAGYTGMGDLAYRRKDYEAALRFYGDAIDKAGAVYRAREATLGRARCLLALGRHGEARALFEQIAATREWRGEATAESVYRLGEIAHAAGDHAAAVAYFQRVYVGYRKFLPWVARSYLESGKVFESMAGADNDRKALDTYREFLRTPELLDLPEASEVRERLTMVQARIGPS